MNWDFFFQICIQQATKEYKVQIPIVKSLFDFYLPGRKNFSCISSVCVSKNCFLLLPRTNIPYLRNVLKYFSVLPCSLSDRNLWEYFLIATFILDNFHFNTSDYLSQFSLHKCNLITLSWIRGLWIYCYFSFNVENSLGYFENFRFIRKLHMGEAKKDMRIPIPQIMNHLFSAKIMPLDLAIT